MSFCKQVCPWAVRQAGQWSTWRGLFIGTASIITIFNPLLGAAVLKTVGVVIGSVEVLKNDDKNDY